jgi:large conductance mechanosensitive channel
MLKEFRAFIMRGNVLDLAVGVIIGAAFGKIVTSLVNDVIMPPIGLALGKVDFSNLYVTLNGQAYASLSAARAAGAPVIAYGAFLNTVIEFLVIAACVFLIIKAVNRLYRKPAEEQAEEANTRPCPYCRSSISAEAVRCPHCTSEISPVPA